MSITEWSRPSPFRRVRMAPPVWLGGLLLLAASSSGAFESAVPSVLLRESTATGELRGELRKILEEQRQKLHIPGLALVVVKDDKVTVLETMGLRDCGRTLP